MNETTRGGATGVAGVAGAVGVTAVQRARRIVRTAVVLALLPLFGRAAPGCATPEPISPDEFCDDARRGIALRTQSCTQDVDLANARYELAKQKLVCNQTKAIDAGYGCSSYLLARTCEEVAKLGDDVNAWVNTDVCKGTFSPFLSQDPNNPTINQACTSDASSCSCRILEGAKNEGTCAAPATGEGMLPTCCASDGYPGKGSCTCGAIYCAAQGAEGSRTCECAPKPIGVGTPSLGCNRLSFPELAGGVCCLALGNQRCVCSSNTACGSEQTQVGTCDASTFCSMALGAERIEVAKCSP